MGAFLEKPKTEKYNESGSGNGLQYGVSSMQGWRVEMEDAHIAAVNLQDDLKDWSFFAVFDGHAGATVSAHCSEHLLSFIIQSEEFQQAVLKCKNSLLSADIIENIKKAIHGGFLRLDEAMRQIPEVSSGHDKSGTTAVCALISPTHLFVANCGDSRAVLFESLGIGFSTVDHKPVNPEEKERIQNAGGSVMIQRVNGALAVSRSLGDYDYKNVERLGPCEQLVSPEPEMYIYERKEYDEFLVLACDGIWDVITNEDLCAFIRSRLAITNDMERIANSVVDTCFYKGSKDNMSLVLVAFPGAVEVRDLAVKQEQKLEDDLKTSVLAICNSERDHLTMNYIISELSKEEFNFLPPGGGLYAKRGYIESLVKLHRPDVLDNPSDKTDGLYNLEFLPSSTMQSRIASLFEKVSPDDYE